MIGGRGVGSLLLLLCLLQLDCIVRGVWAQRSPYSLQAAVDELAAKYPLNAPPSQQHYYGALGAAADQDYWDEDTDYPANNNKNRNRHRLNKALAKYLERENYDADHGGLTLGPFGGYEFDEDNNKFLPNTLNEKKRSSYFRERDNKYENPPTSVFREREIQVTNTPEQSELTEQFLREIEEAQEHDREERYKDALRHLWEKYQQQENEIKGDLFEEKKRMRMPPYYMLMQKKRSYPMLPWLPNAAERKKRFPVSKRSTKRSPNEGMTLAKTDEKVAQELSELFGPSKSVDEKKKRSTDEQTEKTDSTQTPVAPSTVASEVPAKKNADNANTNSEDMHNHAHGHGHGHHSHDHHSGHHDGHSHNHGLDMHKHKKRSDQQNSNESREESDESEEHEEHEEHEEEEESEEHEDHGEHDEEEEEEERKKKREVVGITTDAGAVADSNGNAPDMKRANMEMAKMDHLMPMSMPMGMPMGMSNQRRKKSIQWSKYFGLDRKKKSLKRDNKSELDMKKRSTSDEDSTERDDDDNEEDKKKKRAIDPEKLESMDKKLQSIEDFIIDETIKYTGAHEGIANPEEIRRLKDHVLSRLATAYSLEKMRRALDKLRQSVDNENHLLRNVIDPEMRLPENDLLDNQKRLSVKKEKAPIYDETTHSLSAAVDKTKEMHSNAMLPDEGKDIRNSDADNDDDEDKKRKKKKRNGYLRYPELPNDFSGLEEEQGPGRYEALNDAYLGNKNYIIGSNQCPMIEAMAERCRGVDLLSGDVNQELLPICGVHQICYLCGTSQVACDYQYLAEADDICNDNSDCQAAARSVLMILRGTPGPQLGPRECLKNPCLYSAMREIGL